MLSILIAPCLKYCQKFTGPICLYLASDIFFHLNNYEINQAAFKHIHSNIFSALLKRGKGGKKNTPEHTIPSSSHLRNLKAWEQWLKLIEIYLRNLVIAGLGPKPLFSLIQCVKKLLSFCKVYHCFRKKLPSAPSLERALILVVGLVVRWMYS